MEKSIVIVAAGRTAIGKFRGTPANIPASTLGSIVIKGLLDKIKLDPKYIDEVILGNVLTAGLGQNPARQAALLAGLPKEITAFTINKVCGSGLKAIYLGAQAIQCGDANIVIAGGQENMDLAPHVLQNSRDGKRMGDWPLIDTMLTDGLLDHFNNYHMGVTAETIATKFNVTREEQDQFALSSQQKAKIALETGRFKDEIIPVIIPQKKGDPLIFDKDEYPKPETTLADLQKLTPAFRKEGTVTAGNSSGINDAAAAVIMMTEENANKLGLPILARFVAAASAGVDPEVMGTGPIPASQKCLEKAGWKREDLDLIEANEAFAVQAIVVNRAMGWDLNKVNVNGGAIALGHPIGASGARILVTLIHEMQKRKAKKGIATLCIGGGMGIAMAIENNY
jgi:acetyl-CoA C-acetyltransferase